MLSLTQHLTAFWTVVVMNCIQPVNWEACLPVHEWLLPEVAQGYKLWTGQIGPYDNEKKYLN
tara:strand:- start:122 stop:307 length:186 start_codon:yes stop_codon:yes gene_type:complete